MTKAFVKAAHVLKTRPSGGSDDLTVIKYQSSEGRQVRSAFGGEWPLPRCMALVIPGVVWFAALLHRPAQLFGDGA